MVLFLCLNVSLDRKIKVVPLNHISVLWSCPEGSVTDEVKNNNTENRVTKSQEIDVFLAVAPLSQVSVKDLPNIHGSTPHAQKNRNVST